MSPLSPPCSYIPKEKSPHSISSLDENEIDEVRKKLDHLQSLLIQVKNQLNSSPNDEDDDDNMIDERIFPNTSTELSLLQTTERIPKKMEKRLMIHVKICLIMLHFQ
ncbi:unnamed protein product [Schistosoma mattheei]|uniref:Uncharacterized protein n=1 Tax=Schistosoma mattheei TaxID=31246 RepID=A0AA85BRU0_9TREM|nr:unnamed protein product [Schistosoma mattheei]